ncbi:MAG: TlpA disulfide reductase family protein [Pseudomonadota bacterium]
MHANGKSVHPTIFLRLRLRRASAVFCALIAVLLSACNSEPATNTPTELRSGTWHADITLPGGDAQLGVELARDGDTLSATLINGTERVKVPNATFSDGRLTLQFPAFNNRIDAKLTETGLEGSLTLVKRYGKTQVMPFRAQPGARAQQTNQAAAGRDLSGRWAVNFTEDDGTVYPAVGEFQQRGNRLLGTFLTETGDYRFLGGSVHGDELRLSTFDGAHAFLFTATLDDNDELTGKFWSGTESIEDWTARRDETVALTDPSQLTMLREGYERFEFTFPDETGNSVSLDDPRFAGKVVIVTLAGTWCPNCHDEAALMAELYPKYRDQGVEIIALMYEHFEDADIARTQILKFREKFNIQYTTLLAGISDKTKAAETLPMLDRVLAFPTTIYIDRTGAVRNIHTGFSGPGTGEYYTKMKADMIALIDELVAETPQTPLGSDPAVASH